MHLLGFSKVALWVEVMLLHPPLSPHWVLAPFFHTSLLKVLLMNMSVWVCPTSTLKATGGCWIFWSWSYRSLLAAWHGRWELNSSPLEEQEVLLTAEPSLWAPVFLLPGQLSCLLLGFCYPGASLDQLPPKLCIDISPCSLKNDWLLLIIKTVINEHVCVCVHVCVDAYAYTCRGQRYMPDVLLNHSPPYLH